MQRLKDKIVLITGGASGIGRGIVRKFAEEGADIIVFDVFLRAPDEIRKEKEEIKSEIEKFNRKSLILTLDVSDPDQVKENVKKAISEFGRIDILINNAGIMPPSHANTIINMKEEHWKHIIDVNLNGAFYVAKYVAKQMIRQKDKTNPKKLRGKIINMSSVEGKQGTAMMGAYCASKFGVIALTQTLAKELASKKILVNAICPGSVKTPMMGPLADAVLDDLGGEYGMKPLLDRSATPKDVANLAIFLASEESDYITGQAINVCGGILFK